MTALNHAISRILAAQMASLPTTANLDATQVAVEPTKLGKEEILARLNKLAAPDGPAILKLEVVELQAGYALKFTMADGAAIRYEIPSLPEQLLRLLAARAGKFLPEDLGAKLRQPH